MFDINFVAPPIFGFESAYQNANRIRKQSSDKDFSSEPYLLTNRWKRLGYCPIIGSMIGFLNLSDYFSVGCIHSENYNTNTTSLSLLYKAKGITRSVVEMTSIGCLLLPVDVIITLMRENQVQKGLSKLQDQKLAIKIREKLNAIHEECIDKKIPHNSIEFLIYLHSKVGIRKLYKVYHAAAITFQPFTINCYHRAIHAENFKSFEDYYYSLLIIHTQLLIENVELAKRENLLEIFLDHDRSYCLEGALKEMDEWAQRNLRNKLLTLNDIFERVKSQFSIWQEAEEEEVIKLISEYTHYLIIDDKGIEVIQEMDVENIRNMANNIWLW